MQTNNELANSSSACSFEFETEHTIVEASTKNMNVYVKIIDTNSNNNSLNDLNDISISDDDLSQVIV